MAEITNIELVERVARALCAADGFDPDSVCVDEKGGSEPMWLAACYDAGARAAISTIFDVLKEPTIRSITAGAVAAAGGEGRIPDGADNWRALATFRAMLLASPLFDDSCGNTGNIIFESNSGSGSSHHDRAMRRAEKENGFG